MEKIIIKFTDKYICFHSLFKLRRLETKDNYLSEASSKKIKNHWAREWLSKKQNSPEQ